MHSQVLTRDYDDRIYYEIMEPRKTVGEEQVERKVEHVQYKYYDEEEEDREELDDFINKRDEL